MVNYAWYILSDFLFGRVGGGGASKEGLLHTSHCFSSILHLKKKLNFIPFFNVTFLITLLAFVAFISWKSKDIELR